MALWRGASIFSIVFTWPSLSRVTSSNGSLSDWGEIIRRPLGSLVIQIQDPSPRCDECNNSTLNPGVTVKDSAGVACGVSAAKLEEIVVSKLRARQAMQNI